MARKPGKKQKENPVECTEEGERWKGNIREGSREGKTDWLLQGSGHIFPDNDISVCWTFISVSISQNSVTQFLGIERNPVFSSKTNEKFARQQWSEDGGGLYK